MFPDTTDDVTQLTGYTYVQTGNMIYPISRELEGFTKTAISVAAITKGCDTNNYFTIYYWTDSNSDWVSLGTFKTSPQPTALSFASGAGLEFRWIKFKVLLTSNSSSASPELRSLEFDYDAPTKPLRAWTFEVATTQHNAGQILTNLHTSQEKSTLLLFYPSGDSNKDSFRVKIKSLPENIMWDAAQENGKVQVTVEELLRR